VQGCIQWTISKICDTVWDAVKKEYVKICHDEKICKEYSNDENNNTSSSGSSGYDYNQHQHDYEINHNIQRLK
jgi:hypothetical protein